MATFPLISTSGLLTSDWEVFKAVRSKPQVRTPWEGGAVQSRARVLSDKWMFQVGSRSMVTTQLNTLISFFDNNQGGAFNFVHPITGNAHEVKFVDDELPEIIPTGTGPNARWEIEGINLEEIVGSTITVVTTTTSSSSTTTTTAP